MSTPKRIFVLAIYLVCITASAIYCLRRPLYNWDMLAYTDIALRMDRHAAADAYTLTYRLAASNIPSEKFRALTDSSSHYRYMLSKNQNEFDQQLPFYVIKPLYTGLVFLSYKLGISLPLATLVPGFISYLLLGCLLFYWLSLYLRLPVAFFVGLLAMISSPLIEVAKTASPDCLSALLLLCAFYFILQRPSLLVVTVFLVLGIFARLDNIIVAAGLLVIMYGTRKWANGVSLRSFLAINSCFVACYFLVSTLTHAYGWSVFYYNDFADHLRPRFANNEHFSAHGYLRLVYEHILSAINRSFIAVFMLMLFLHFDEQPVLRRLSFEKIFLLFIPAVVIVRFFLYPDIADRFYIAFYLVIIILTAKKFGVTRGERARLRK